MVVRGEGETRALAVVRGDAEVAGLGDAERTDGWGEAETRGDVDRTDGATDAEAGRVVTRGEAETRGEAVVAEGRVVVEAEEGRVELVREAGFDDRGVVKVAEGDEGLLREDSW